MHSDEEPMIYHLSFDTETGTQFFSERTSWDRIFLPSKSVNHKSTIQRKSKFNYGTSAVSRCLRPEARPIIMPMVSNHPSVLLQIVVPSQASSPICRQWKSSQTGSAKVAMWIYESLMVVVTSKNTCWSWWAYNIRGSKDSTNGYGAPLIEDSRNGNFIWVVLFPFRNTTTSRTDSIELLFN